MYFLTYLYYRKANHCDSQLVYSYFKKLDSSSQPEPPISTLTQDLEFLTTTHDTLKKAVSDLSSKITSLQAQESKLSDQIKTISDVLGKHTTNPPQYVSDRKSNIVCMALMRVLPKHPNTKDCKKISRLP